MSTKIVSLLAILFLLTVAGAFFVIGRQGTLLKTSAPNSATNESEARPVYVVGENTPLPTSEACIAEHIACEEACAAVPEPEVKDCLDLCTSAFDVCMFDYIETSSL